MKTEKELLELFEKLGNYKNLKIVQYLDHNNIIEFRTKEGKRLAFITENEYKKWQKMAK